MPGVNEYHKSILGARTRALVRSKEVARAVQDSVALAAFRVEALLDLGGDPNVERGGIRGLNERRVAEARLGELISIANSMGEDISASVTDAVGRTARDHAHTTQAATSRLAKANRARVVASYGRVPLMALDLYHKRTAMEGIKASPRVWAEGQAHRMQERVSTAIASGQSARELARGLQAHLLGGEGAGLSGSVSYQAQRLARTEISTAAWEAGAMTATLSPVTEALIWRRSASHKKWDACDLMAGNDQYNLGAGVYPAGRIPARPHPQCLCYQETILRPVEQWNDPKTTPPQGPVRVHSSILPASVRGKIGGGSYFSPDQLPGIVEGMERSARLHITANFAATQGRLFTGLRQATAAAAAELDAAIGILRQSAVLVAAGGFIPTDAVEEMQGAAWAYATQQELRQGLGAPFVYPQVVHERVGNSSRFVRPDYAKPANVQGWVRTEASSVKRLGLANAVHVKVQKQPPKAIREQLANMDRALAEVWADARNKYPVFKTLKVDTVLYQGMGASAKTNVIGTASSPLDGFSASKRKALWFNVRKEGVRMDDAAPVYGKFTTTPHTHGTARHELMHHADGAHRSKLRFGSDGSSAKSNEFDQRSAEMHAKYGKALGSYANGDPTGMEVIAEAGASMMHPEYKRGDLPQELEEFVDQILYSEIEED